MSDNRIFYNHPEQKFCGDFIPFYHDGVFHLYVIIGSDWQHLTTTDFVNFENHGVAIPRGDVTAQDRDIYTGCIFEWEGVFHCYYCGHNEDLLAEGKPSEVILHATSTDLYTWEKQTDVFIAPDETRFMRRGWRDAFVYRDEERDEFRMLITGAEKHTHSKRWGLTALATSKNLIDWTIEDPLYAPSVYDAHECADLFELNGKWYLIFSTFTRWWETRYRISDTPYGPFVTPKDDLVDNRSFYAAKTVTDGKKRYLVGWTARREDDKDTGNYLWGGALTVHEVTARADGTLAFAPVSTVTDCFNEEISKTLSPAFGRGVGAAIEGGYSLSSDGYLCAKVAQSESDDYLLRCTVTVSENGAAGVLLRADLDGFEKWCSVEIDRRRGVLFFDHFGKFFWDQKFDEQRPLADSDRYELTVLSKDNVICIYCNGVALTTRCYGFTGGEIGIFVKEGDAKITDLSIKKYSL